MNWGILLLLVLFAWHGYGQGFIKGLSSVLTPLLGVWLALRRCDDLAPLLCRLFGDYTVSRLVSFFFIIACVWIGLALLNRLLFKLVDWPRWGELDQFLGACLGWAKATVLIWVILIVMLGAFPPVVRIVERSSASMRILALGELATGPVHKRGLAPATRDEDELAMTQNDGGQDTRFLRPRGP